MFKNPSGDMEMEVIRHEVAKASEIKGNETFLELYSSKFSGAYIDGKYVRYNEPVIGYTLTYLTRASENGFDCNNSEYYLNLEEANEAFDARLKSDDPFLMNKSYDCDKYDDFQRGPLKQKG